MPLQFDTFYPWLDLAGLTVFAASGALLMRHELYVTCALLAAASFVVLTRVELAAPWPALLAFVLGFLLRGAAIRWKLTLPAHRGH